MRLMIVFALVLFNSYFVFAQLVTEKEARETAAAFLMQQDNYKATPDPDNMDMNVFNVDGTPTAYAINNPDRGFVIIAADKRQKPVIGYSLKNNLDFTNLPPALQSLLHSYGDISLINKQPHPGWQQLGQSNTRVKAKSFPEAPVMLSTVWGQSWPYNAYCPAHPNGSNGHTLVGCVATAMAQVMYYWQYPSVGTGSESYFWGVDSTVHFDQATYNWSAMDNYINSANRHEIAQVSFHTAVSVKMNFGPSASGSSIDKAANALKDHFQYLPTLRFLSRENFDYVEWKTLMQNEMLAGRPVIYAGFDNAEGGHAFILDGFRDSAYFHINWGWNGGSNGYFHLDNLNSSGGNFATNQRAVIGIMPYGTTYCGDYWYTSNNYTFDDGSGYSFYQSNSSCTYLIEAPAQGPLDLQFSRWQLADAGDKVTIYDGEDANAPVLATFDGSQTPSLLTSTSNKVFLEFETDGSGEDLGWELQYSSVASSTPQKMLDEVSVSPNPARDFVTVSKAQGLQLELFSIDGRLLSSQRAESDNSRIDVSSLSSGVYLLNLTTNEGYRSVKKLVVK